MWGRAEWVWMMFQMSVCSAPLLHRSSHTPPVSTRSPALEISTFPPHSTCFHRCHSSQSLWSFTASLLPMTLRNTWRFLIPLWHCRFLMKPPSQDRDSCLTPTWITQWVQVFTVGLWNLPKKGFWATSASLVCCLCTDDARFQRDFDPWSSKDEDKGALILLRNLTMVVQLLGKWPARRRFALWELSCLFYFHSAIKHLRNFWQRTYGMRSYFMQGKCCLWSRKDQMRMRLVDDRKKHWRASLTAERV